jgi:hypothetical protein
MTVKLLKSEWIEGNLRFKEKPRGSGGQIHFGYDDYGMDIKLFGATASSFALWDASDDALEFDGADIKLGDADYVKFGDDNDITVEWDGTNFHIESAAAASPFLIGATSKVMNTTLKGTFTMGADTEGYDFKAFGATTGTSVLWDASEDQLVITGPADVPALKLAGAGSKSAAAYAAAGVHWADGGTPSFIADQMYARADIGGTVYIWPLWADS